MKIKLSHRAGTVLNLVLSCILTLMIISTAFLLNAMHRTTSVPVAAQLKADYQMESAIVMQMQKIRNDSKADYRKVNFSREISPGYLLMMSAEQVSPAKWKFDLTLQGPGFTRNLKAEASQKNPDRIIYLRD